MIFEKIKLRGSSNLDDWKSKVTSHFPYLDNAIIYLLKYNAS